MLRVAILVQLFLMAVNAKTGEMGARQRGFAKANVLAVGDDLIVLDENGELAIATRKSPNIFNTRMGRAITGWNNALCPR